MSELRADTITASDGTSPVTLTKQSAAKAWVNFNGTGTIAARDSLNLSSLTDNGTGNYTLNYTNSMSNDNYAKADGGGHWTEQSTTDSTATASMLTYSSAASLADYTNVTFMTVGDLA